MNWKCFKLARLRKGIPPPPPKISVSVLRSDHDYLVDIVAGTDKPIYEVIHAKLMSETKMKECNMENEDLQDIIKENALSLRIYRDFIRQKGLEEEFNTYRDNLDIKTFKERFNLETMIGGEIRYSNSLINK